MERETCRKFRWFWAWQDDREEEWLGSMSRGGWHLLEFSIPGIYTFQKGEAKNYVYRLDFQTSGMKDRGDYLQLFRDAGWEHLGSMSAWEYFRKEARAGEEPEIFTDQESKIRKYLRVLRFLALFFGIMVTVNAAAWRHLAESGAMGGALIGVTAGIFILYITGMARIYLRIKKLKASLHG